MDKQPSKYDQQLAFVLGDLLKLSENSPNCRLRIVPLKDCLKATIEKNLKRKGKRVWEMVDEYVINFILHDETPEYPGVTSPNMGDVDYVQAGRPGTYEHLRPGTPVRQQIFPGKYTFQLQRPRDKTHLFVKGPITVSRFQKKRKSTQFPFSKRRPKRRRNYKARPKVAPKVIANLLVSNLQFDSCDIEELLMK